MTKELWQTMNEPEIDPLLEDALTGHAEFLRWWTARIIPSRDAVALVEARANYVREAESISYQTKPQRETDLHLVVDTPEGRVALLTESKVVAPSSANQPEDYRNYGEWGKSAGRWNHAHTILIAPRSYLDNAPADETYDHYLAYEEIAEAAASIGCSDLARYLRAGILRHAHFRSGARNPDLRITGFRVKYGDLLREESPQLFQCLSARGRRRFGGSETWFHFPLPEKAPREGYRDEIVHKVSNRTGEQRSEDPQYIALHVARAQDSAGVLPDLGRGGHWRASKSNAIYDIELEERLKMTFQEFEADKARVIWLRIESLRAQWDQIDTLGFR